MNVGQVGFTGWRRAPDETGDPPSGDAGCEDGGSIGPSVLFHKEGPDADAVDLSDVTQGHVADCFFLAPLAAMARTPGGQAFIRSAIVENHGPDGSVASYTVTLHRPAPGVGFLWHEVKVVVSASDFGCNHAAVRLDKETGDREIWPLVYESAYLQTVGGAAALLRNEGGEVPRAMQALTGQAATAMNVPGAEHAIEAALRTQGLVVVGTKPTAETPVVPSHAYVVTKIEGSGSDAVVYLHDPHNDDNADLKMTYGALTQVGTRVFIGSLP